MFSLIKIKEKNSTIQAKSQKDKTYVYVYNAAVKKLVCYKFTGIKVMDTFIAASKESNVYLAALHM